VAGRFQAGAAAQDAVTASKNEKQCMARTGPSFPPAAFKMGLESNFFSAGLERVVRREITTAQGHSPGRVEFFFSTNTEQDHYDFN
jgi:hypothetical protein